MDIDTQDGGSRPAAAEMTPREEEVRVEPGAMEPLPGRIEHAADGEG